MSEKKWAKILYQKCLNSEDPLLLFRCKHPPKGSKSWNFMMQCPPLISKHLTWDIGNGEEALFWEDSWDGLPSPDSYNLPARIKDALTTKWGKLVSNYKHKVETNKVTSWEWKPLQDPTITKEEILAYNEFIRQRQSDH